MTEVNKEAREAALRNRREQSVSGALMTINDRIIYRAGFEDGWESRGKADGIPQPEPVPMILHCPHCHFQHIDEAEPDKCETCGHDKDDHDSEECFRCAVYKNAPKDHSFTAWLNPPHRKHRCKNPDCNETFCPALINTTGVAELPEPYAQPEAEDGK